MHETVSNRAAPGLLAEEGAILGRGAFLHAVAFAAERLGRSPRWDGALDAVLERMGRAAGASRVSLCENLEGEDGRSGVRVCREWVAGSDAATGDPALAWARYEGLERWAEELSRGHLIVGDADAFPPSERAALEARGIRSTAVVPIFVGEAWWGSLAFDQTAGARDWTEFDLDALRAAAAVVGSALDRRLAEEQRAETEERCRRLVEGSPLGILVLQDGRVVMANEATARVLGATERGDLVGRSVLSFVHERSRQTALARLQRLREGSDVPPARETLVRLDGSAVEVETTASALLLDGQPAVQVVIRDLTDDERVARQVRTHAAYLEALHETSVGLMKRLDARELLETILTRAASLVGTEHGYVYELDDDGVEMEVRVGIGAFVDWKGYRLGRGEGAAGRAWESGEPLVVADYDVWPNRAQTFPKGLFHAVVCVPLRSGSEVVGVLGLAHVEEGRTFTSEDVSILTRFAELASIKLDSARLYSEAQQELVARRKAERALQFQAHLLDAVENAVIATDVDDTITYWNHFASKLLGRRPEEVLGKRFRDVVPVPDAIAEDVNRTTDAGDTWSGDFELERPDGSTFIAFARVAPIKAPDGSAMGQVGVIVDVTDRRRMEEALRASLRREKDVSKRLIALDEMKTTFLEAVSHELRNPLSVILGVALTLERDDVELTDERARKLLGKLSANARKLDRLLSDLLDLDRLSRGILQPRLRPTDISALVRQVLAGNDVSGGRSIRLVLSDVIIQVEPAKVERIIENLVANAVRHTPEGTPIWVRVERVDEGAIIAVEDAGPGVPAHLHDAIFEAFRQAGDGRRTSPGVGIGLSLVARFAELHGGRAWVEDRPGGGASFRVFLPAEHPDVDSSHEERPGPPSDSPR